MDSTGSGDSYGFSGNTLTSPVEFQFFYGTRKPEVIATTPAEFASVTQVTEVSAILQDHSGEGIDFDRASILLSLRINHQFPVIKQ